jgi:hypothetical protein
MCVCGSGGGGGWMDGARYLTAMRAQLGPTVLFAGQSVRVMSSACCVTGRAATEYYGEVVSCDALPYVSLVVQTPYVVYMSLFL